MTYCRILLFVLLAISFSPSFGQERKLTGKILDEDKQPIAFANLVFPQLNRGTSTDADGYFSFDGLPEGEHTLQISSLAYHTRILEIRIPIKNNIEQVYILKATSQQLDETVVSGTMKPVSRLESPVPVEVYSPAFIKKNPTANIFEALQQVNGVRPQVNCNVCNTGDIHINGLEGPYTLVLIDGMPIVSGLGTVYGLSGIPNSLIQQVEIIKGPASSLYGSEAVGGLINIITKDPAVHSDFVADAFISDWGEYNLDLGVTLAPFKKSKLLLGVNLFDYSDPRDENRDNFTDLTLQQRISVFQKWSIQRARNRELTMAGRFFYEDRWGGEMDWNPTYRLTDEIYGENIFTRRWELLAKYQLPFEGNWMFSLSYNDHHQDAAYGTTPYIADQRIGFVQLTTDIRIGNHDVLLGSSIRFQQYNDNTPATENADRYWIPSIFVQDEMEFSKPFSILLGSRFDVHQKHNLIFTPRMALKWKPGEFSVFRINAGTGFRVVNLFTEEHAALTGSRTVLVEEDLLPERSQNINLNYLQKWYLKNGLFLSLDASAFYTHFSNSIIPDYETNPNQIIYRNLEGSANSRGLSLNLDMAFPGGTRFMGGVTLQEVTNTRNEIKTRQLLTESYSATWTISLPLTGIKSTFDYTGNLYGPMRLPLLGELDPRSPYSPVWSIQNIQFTYKGLKDFEVYAGVKNLLNWTPARGVPFLIARAHDPFDKEVTFGNNGNPVATADNPYALTFDPTYVYGPNQGIRTFLGLRYQFR